MVATNSHFRVGVPCPRALSWQPLTSRVKVLDGEVWVGVATEPTEYDRFVRDAESLSSAVRSDGRCWTSHPDTGDGDALFERIDADGTRTAVTRAEIGFEPDQHVGARLFVDPDGVLWATVSRPGRNKFSGSFDGMVKHDGSTWSHIAYDGEDLPPVRPLSRSMLTESSGSAANWRTGAPS